MYLLSTLIIINTINAICNNLNKITYDKNYCPYIVTVTLATFVMMKAENTLNVNKQMILSNLDALAEQESNNEGSGKFFYKYLLGQPKDCIMYKHVKVDGNILVRKLI